MSCLRWGIAISIPGKKKGSTKRVLVRDKQGEMIFTSQTKARDFLKAASGGKGAGRIDAEACQPKVIRVKVTVTIPK
jgi:hypothetical protein